MNDVFYTCDEEIEIRTSISGKEMLSVEKKLFNEGYRKGKAEEEELILQEDFDKGLVAGLNFGDALGEYYGKCVMISSNFKDIISNKVNNSNIICSDILSIIIAIQEIHGSRDQAKLDFLWNNLTSLTTKLLKNAKSDDKEMDKMLHTSIVLQKSTFS